MKSIVALGLAALLASANANAFDVPRKLGRFAGDVVDALAAQAVPATGTLEVGFSPKGGAESLVVKVIDSSRTDLKVMAYSFTSARVTSALLRALKRGVAVSIVADEKHNLGDGASPKAKAAFAALAEAGAQVRVIDAFAIHHDKVLISEGRHVQLGSFNYSEAAASRNSENVLVNWDNPALAKVYASHFARNWALAKPFRSPF
ncbi:phospholipase D-like domain-containing protein [Acidovorax sp. sic0104]